MVIKAINENTRRNGILSRVKCGKLSALQQAGGLDG